MLSPQRRPVAGAGGSASRCQEAASASSSDRGGGAVVLLRETLGPAGIALRNAGGGDTSRRRPPGVRVQSVPFGRQRPCSVIERLCSVIERLCSVIERPCSVTERPRSVANDRVRSPERPCSVTERPCSVVNDRVRSSATVFGRRTTVFGHRTTVFGHRTFYMSRGTGGGGPSAVGRRPDCRGRPAGGGRGLGRLYGNVVRTGTLVWACRREDRLWSSAAAAC